MVRQAKNRIAIGILAVVAAMGLGVATVQTASAQEKAGAPRKLTDAEALKLQNRLFDGMVAHDLHGLASILDKDLIYIHIGGMTQTSRDQFLSWVDTGPKFVKFDLTNPKVFSYDDVMALTGHVDSYSKGKNGEDQVLHLILSNVWARKPDGWQLVLLQYTQIPEPKK